MKEVHVTRLWRTKDDNGFVRVLPEVTILLVTIKDVGVGGYLRSSFDNKLLSFLL